MAGDSPMTTTDVAVRDPGLDRLARLGQWLALSESGRDDEKSRGAAAALRLYYAEQLELPPLAAAELSVIKGRLFVSAQLLRALAERKGYRVLRRDDTPETCTAVLLDLSSGEELGAATFTLKDAKAAGLIRNGSAWQTHPARMLWARASKNVIVDFAPAVALGIMLEDEAVEVSGTWVPEGGGDALGAAEASTAQPPHPPADEPSPFQGPVGTQAALEADG